MLDREMTQRKMRSIRAFEQNLSDFLARGIVGGTSHFCIGQEACAVGVLEAARPTDWVISNHRGHGHLLARGLDPRRLLAELKGEESGYCKGRGGSQHLSCIARHFLGTNGITGGGIPIGAGCAFALKYLHLDDIAIVFFGDGASNQGTFHETLNMASLWKLPVLFVCENNLYAMSTPTAHGLASGTVAPRAAAYNIPSAVADGLDVDAVYKAAQKACAYVRSGAGPFLLELMTYRQCGHSRNDKRVYRTREEEQRFAERDPLHGEPVSEADIWIPPEEPPLSLPSLPPKQNVTLPTEAHEVFFSQAIREALEEELLRDPSVFLMGEDIGVYGGAFGVTKGLWEKFGASRIWETPISENSFTGIGVGAAMMGLRPVVEIMFMDFLALALDQILNSAAKLEYMYAGQVKVPMVIRTPGGAKGGYGASHSQTLTNLLVGIPGIKVVAPSTPAQAKGLLKSAIRYDGPVVFVENKRLYGKKGVVPAGEVLLPLDKAVVVAEGTDLTIAAYSAMTPMALAVRDAFAEKGVSIEVIDLISLQPLDTETLFQSIRKTGRLVIAEEACLTGGVGAEIAARVAEECLDALEAPIRRVAAKDQAIPAGLALEKEVLPQPEQLVNAVKELLEY